GVTYAERPLLFRNLEDGKFDEIGQTAGPVTAKRYVGRAAASGDFWNDGSESVLMTALDASPVLLRNRTRNGGHWLRVKLQGSKSNRDGFGAKVEVTAGGKSQVLEARANSSFESASDPRVHFGMGQAAQVDEVRVRWPLGRVSELKNIRANQEIVVREPDR